MRLLACVGMSPAIVLEAVEWCRGPEGPFGRAPNWTTELRTSYEANGFSPVTSVRLLATEGSYYTWLLRPEIRPLLPDLQIVVTAGLADLCSTSDQAILDEFIYDWFLQSVQEVGPDRLLVCIAGGYKSMSGTLQKAASLFGARQVFHVLSSPEPPETLDERWIDKRGNSRFPKATPEALAAWAEAGALFVPCLGEEPGWASLRRLQRNPTVQDRPSGDGVIFRTLSDRSVSDAIKFQLRQVARHAEAFERKGLPFDALRLWSENAFRWLSEPVDIAADAEWVRALPKIELHCHLGGFGLDADHLLQLAAAVEGDPDAPDDAREAARRIWQCEGRVKWPEDWPRPTKPISLEDYMRLGDLNGSRILKSRAALRLQVQALYRALVNDRVVYAEIRCSPQNYAVPGKSSAWDVLHTIIENFERAQAEMAGEQGNRFCQVNLLIIATRRREGDLSPIARHLSLAVTANDLPLRKVAGTGLPGVRVVGVDLAGFEEPASRPEYFHADFRAIHRCGLNVTVHAGENDDVESIWQAVYQLHARRIGHGLHLTQSRDLMQVMANERIAVELCPYANMQIRGYRPFTALGSEPPPSPVYPLRTFLNKGLTVTINSDNLGISAATLSDNLLLACELCPKEDPLTRRDLLQLVAFGIESAFITPEERAELRNRVNAELSRSPCAPADASMRPPA